jgi:hypothetical protein
VSVDGAQKGSAARNVTETKFIWKNRKLKRPYKRSFLIQMALQDISIRRPLVVVLVTSALNLSTVVALSQT